MKTYDLATLLADEQLRIEGEDRNGDGWCIQIPSRVGLVFAPIICWYPDGVTVFLGEGMFTEWDAKLTLADHDRPDVDGNFLAKVNIAHCPPVCSADTATKLMELEEFERRRTGVSVDIKPA